MARSSGVPRDFVGGLKNSFENRGQTERGYEGGSLLGVLDAAVTWYKKFHFI